MVYAHPCVLPGKLEEKMRQLGSHYPYCFGCGEKHPTGLHLKMRGEGMRVEGTFKVTEHHQGAPGLAHGGILASALDEGMGFLMYLLEEPAVTARLEVDYRKPVPVGSELHLEGEVVRREGRKIWTRMRAMKDGEVAVEAMALYVTVDASHFLAHAPPEWVEAAARMYNP